MKILELLKLNLLLSAENNLNNKLQIALPNISDHGVVFENSGGNNDDEYGELTLEQ